MAKRAAKRPADERKRLILKGAEEVFGDLGFAGADTTTLARAAGISAPALYRYFPSKKDLFLQTLKHAGPRLASILAGTIERSSDPLDAVWNFGLGYYEHVQAHAPVMRLWFQALSEADDAETRAVLQRNFASLVDLLQANIEEGRRQGLVADDVDARVAAWHFMAIGLTFEMIHVLGLDGELDRGKVEDWGRLYVKSIRRAAGEIDHDTGRSGG